MRLLLDTPVLIWWLEDDPRMGRARAMIIDPANDVHVSLVSLCEIAIKTRTGKLNIALTTAIDAVERDRMTMLSLTPAHLLVLETLPFHHRDPFDHLLIAQAIVEGLTFVSNDRHMPAYTVPLMTCS